MRLIWTCLCCFFAFGAVLAGIIAFTEFERMGDLRFTWGFNSLLAACWWITTGFGLLHRS